MMKQIILSGIFALFLCSSSYAQMEGNDPVEPFKIAGNIYYVGASDLTSYLITTPKGHILIDSGSKETVAHIKKNVAKLGFKLEDIKIILNSHAHTDHAGGIAELKKLTGATFYANERDRPLLEKGGLNDPNFGDRFPYEALKPDRILKDRQKVKLGDVAMQANFTPGHTPGCTTWTTDVKDNGKTLKAIFVCSVSTPGYKLVGNANYPEIVADYNKSFAWLKKQKPNIFLAAHGGMFDMQDKMNKLAVDKSVNPFIDPVGFADYIKNAEEGFNEALAEQKSKKK